MTSMARIWQIGDVVDASRRSEAFGAYLLGTLDPGDSFGVARIDGGSFSERTSSRA